MLPSEMKLNIEADPRLRRRASLNFFCTSLRSCLALSHHSCGFCRPLVSFRSTGATVKSCAHLVSSEGTFDAKDSRCCWIKSEAFFRYPCPSTTLDAWRLRRVVNRLLGGYRGCTGGGALRSFLGRRIKASRGSLSSPASESSKWRFFESQLRLIVVNGSLWSW